MATVSWGPGSTPSAEAMCSRQECINSRTAPERRVQARPLTVAPWPPLCSAGSRHGLVAGHGPGFSACAERTGPPGLCWGNSLVMLILSIGRDLPSGKSSSPTPLPARAGACPVTGALPVSARGRAAPSPRGSLRCYPDTGGPGLQPRRPGTSPWPLGDCAVVDLASPLSGAGLLASASGGGSRPGLGEGVLGPGCPHRDPPRAPVHSVR